MSLFQNKCCVSLRSVSAFIGASILLSPATALAGASITGRYEGNGGMGSDSYYIGATAPGSSLSKSLNGIDSGVSAGKAYTAIARTQSNASADNMTVGASAVTSVAGGSHILRSGATARLNDRVTIYGNDGSGNALRTGERIRINLASMLVHGTVSSVGSLPARNWDGTATYGINVTVSGTGISTQIGRSSKRQTELDPVDPEDLQLADLNPANSGYFEVIVGVPFDISMNLEVSSYLNGGCGPNCLNYYDTGGSASVEANYANTLYWGGFSKVLRAATGELVNWSVESRDGMDWGNRSKAWIVETPEPAMFALFGLGLVGIAARRRRAV